MSGLNNFYKPVVDNENDASLFERLEQNAIEHYPNPSRRGCPPKDILERFVESPAEVNVRDLNELHIFHCAECTLDLKQFREAREKRITHDQRFHPWRGKKWWAAIAAILVVGVALPISKLLIDRNTDAFAEHVANIVLRDGSVERGVETGLVIPRAQVTLRIELAHPDSAGAYEVVLSRRRSMNAPSLKSASAPSTNSSGSWLTTRFDLRDVGAGGYWIGVRSTASGRAWFTFVSIE
jgi:hypothetical protein